jgi:hypothetical protein
VTVTSPLILSFPLSSTVGGGSGTMGLTKTVLEVEGIVSFYVGCILLDKITIMYCC